MTWRNDAVEKNTRSVTPGRAAARAVAVPGLAWRARDTHQEDARITARDSHERSPQFTPTAVQACVTAFTTARWRRRDRARPESSPRARSRRSAEAGRRNDEGAIEDLLHLLHVGDPDPVTDRPETRLVRRPPPDRTRGIGDAGVRVHTAVVGSAGEADAVVIGIAESARIDHRADAVQARAHRAANRVLTDEEVRLAAPGPGRW